MRVTLFCCIAFWATSQSVVAANESNQETAIALFREAVNNGELIYAPDTLVDALGLLYYGSAGETRDEFERVVFPDHSQKDIAELASRRKRAFTGYKSLSWLWLSEGNTAIPSYTRAATEDWGTTVVPLPYAMNDPRAKAAIESEINAVLGDYLNFRLSPEDLTGEQAMLLTCVSAFVSPWSGNFFSTTATKEAAFYASPNHSFTVNMMQSDSTLLYFENDVFQVATLGYANEQAELIVLLPKDAAQIAVAMNAFDSEMLDAILSERESATLDLRLPRIDFTTTIQWRQHLINSGLTLPFTQFVADFSRINDNKPLPLFVSNIKQLLRVSWNERGTRASSVTYASIDPFASHVEPEKPKPIPFIANHPFLFILRETGNSDILFMGLVAKAEQMQ